MGDGKSQKKVVSRVHAVRFMVRNRMDQITKMDKKKREQRFLQAARLRNMIEVRLLLDAGVDPNFCEEDHRTALHIAAEHCTIPLALILLLQPKIELESTSVFGNTPLIVATRSGCTRFVKLLLKNGADPNKMGSQWYAPLHWATMRQDIYVCILLVNGGADPMAENKVGETPFSMAALYFPCPALVRLYLRRGADPNVKSKGEILNVFMEAVLGCRSPEQMEIVRTMLMYGANVNQKHSLSKKTALHLAAVNGNEELAELLIRYGADVEATDGLGRTPADVARIFHFPDLYEMLKEKMWRTPMAASSISIYFSLDEIHQ